MTYAPSSPAQTSYTLPVEIKEALKPNSDGLIPAIAQQHDTGELLMMAWMTAESLAETLHTQQVCYWSRSRNKFWRKGESSGQTQKLIDFRLDCDGDTILLLVDQKGPACHTGRRNCFYRSWQEGTFKILMDPLIAPETLYGSQKS